MGYINFNDLFSFNKIENEVVNKKRKLIENTQKAEQKKYEEKLKKEIEKKLKESKKV
jgi:hypothetical protein